MLSVAPAVCFARSLTSVRYDGDPFPASPARAASMSQFSARGCLPGDRGDHLYHFADLGRRALELGHGQLAAGPGGHPAGRDPCCVRGVLSDLLDRGAQSSVPAATVCTFLETSSLAARHYAGLGRRLLAEPPIWSAVTDSSWAELAGCPRCQLMVAIARCISSTAVLSACLILPKSPRIRRGM